MIIVSGWLRTDADRREHYLAACRPVIEAARATPGCVDFHPAADPLGGRATTRDHHDDLVDLREGTMSAEDIDRYLAEQDEPKRARIEQLRSSTHRDRRLNPEYLQRMPIFRCCADEQRFAGYRDLMGGARVPGGVVHGLPGDLRSALVGNAVALAAWQDITPLARNEFICWVEDAKQEATRERRIRRTQEELEEGQRRPCCWPGCKHRERTGK